MTVSQPPVSRDAIALIEGDECFSYSRMLETADRIAESIEPRSLVLFVADNSIASVCAYVGFLRRGIVPLMAKRDLHEDDIATLVKTYSPSFIWCADDTPATGAERLSERGHVLRETGLDSPVTDDALALLLPTSGSTGSRKYVRLSKDNIAANAASIAEYLAIGPDDRAITTLPFSYSYGISIVNSHLLVGASLVLSERTLFDRELWTEMAQHDVTTFGGVPYTYQMLKRLHFDRMELPSLRYLTQAGGKLDEELQVYFAELCEKRGIDFIVMYGQTEGTARLSYLPAELASTKIGSIGIAIPGGSFSLVDEAGQAIETPQTSGELVYRGANVSLGYASSAADLSKDDENGGVLFTGDIAKRDEDGYYYIVGRMKRFLKVFGNRVNLDDVESLLLAAGFTCACTGKDDAIVIHTLSNDIDGVKQAVVSATGLNKTAFTVNQVDEIPRNDAGKILYSELSA